MKKIILILGLLMLVLPVQGITQVKSIKIEEPLNIKYLNSYNYSIYDNGFYIDDIEKDKIFYYTENSNLLIYIPSPIKTDVSDEWNTVYKPLLITIIGFLLTWGLLIIMIIAFGYYLYKKYRR